MIMRIPILKSILRNLDWFEEARRHRVAPDGSIFIGGINHRLKKAGDWEESKHPRADNGQFGSGSGGSSKPKKPSKTRRKMERREEAASQARVGGAIQSLLSGGSALDKIGWLNTSQKEPEKPATKPKEEAAPAKEPSILDIINQRNEQAAAMRGKVPSMEHPSQRSAREGGPEGGHSPRVLTRTERDYRDSQNQWDNDRRRMGIPVPGDELATLEIPGKIKVEDGELAGSKILSLGNKRAGVIQHTDGSFVVLSQVDRKTVDRKEFEHLDVANRYAEAWLKGGQEVPKQPEKPKAEEKPKPADKVKSAKDTIQENLKSGKLKRETVIAAVISLHEQANAAKSKGDFASSKDLNFQANVMIDAAGIKSHELLSGKGNTTRQNAPSRQTQRNPKDDPFEGDPLHDPLPRGYRVRSPEETERYMREHPYKPPKGDDYEADYKRRTGRNWDPTTA